MLEFYLIFNYFSLYDAFNHALHICLLIKIINLQNSKLIFSLNKEYYAAKKSTCVLTLYIDFDHCLLDIFLYMLAGMPSSHLVKKN